MFLRQLWDYWFVLLVLLALASLLHIYSGLVVIKVVKGIFYALALAGLVVTYLSFRYTARLGGGATPSDIYAIAELTADSVATDAFDVASTLIVVGASATLTALIFGGRWLSLALYLLAVGISMMRRLGSPPFAVFLGSSGAESCYLAEQLTSALLPNRVVSLLRWPDEKADEQVLRASSVRTLAGTSWRSKVDILVRMAPLVILDCRTPTAATMEEGEMLLTSQYTAKTLFVGNERGHCELFARLLANGSVSNETMVFVLTHGTLLGVAIDVAAGHALSSFSRVSVGAAA